MYHDKPKFKPNPILKIRFAKRKARRNRKIKRFALAIVLGGLALVGGVLLVFWIIPNLPGWLLG